MSINKHFKSNFLTIAPNTLLKDAIALLSKQSVDCILVVETDLLGIITKSDLLTAISKRIELETVTVAEVMTQPVVAVESKKCLDLQTAGKILQQHSIGYLPVLAEDGQLLGVIDRKTIVESLSLELTSEIENSCSNQKELERFFLLTPDLLCLASFDGYFKRINPTFSKILGYSDDELLAEPFIDFVHPEDRATTQAELERLIAGETTASFENRYRTNNGEYRWLLWTAKAYLDDETIYAAAKDISDRKLNEAALRENEERWQLALRGANDGIWDWNVQTNEVFFSKRWKEMLGYAEDEVGNTLEEWSKRVHPDDIGWVTEVIQDHFAGETPFYVSEHRVLCKDGSYKWILDRGQALWDEAGNVVRMTGSHTDITLRKQAEEKLARSENLLRTIIDTEPEWVKLIERDGKLLEMNSAGLAIIEAPSLAEMQGKSVFPLVDTEHRQGFIDLTERVFAGESGKLEFELTGLKGRSCWLETNAVPLKEGEEITALLAVTRDISDRKRAELQLQQERDFSNAIIDTVGALIAILDRNGAIVRFNRTCEKVTDYDRAEIEGKLIWDILIVPEERKAVRAVFERLLAGQIPNQYENSWLAKDGTRRLISWSNTALFDTSGQPEYIVTTGIEITEQRRVWDRLEQQYRQTKLLAEIGRKIRLSIRIEDILQTTVTEVQQLLACDRVLVVKIQPNNTALPISEAILPELTSMLGYELADPLLVGKYLSQYRQGEVLAIDNLATASVHPDIKQLLQQFEIQAKLVIPILSQNELKGLLIAHQCYNTRQWQESEVQLLHQLADQIGVALSQAQLLNNLEEMVAQRTSELVITNQLLEEKIVERQQTEAILRENQQKLTGILDNADEAIISVDERQQIQLFNRGAERIFGYGAEEVIGKPLDILLPQTFRQMHRQHIARFSNGSEQSRQMAQRNSKVFGLRKNGSEFPAEASVAKLQTREGLLFTVMLKDITERQQTLAKLEASKTLLTKAEKIAKIGSWEYDHQTKRSSWSDELFEIMGFDRDLSTPICSEIMARVHPEDRLLVTNTLHLGHQQGIPWNFTYRLLLPDGTLKHVESRGEATLDSEGNVLKVLETLMDVSDRVRAEQSFQRSEEHLHLITDALPVLIAYIDVNQHYRYINRTYETWHGKSRSYIIGKPMQELWGESNYRKILPYVKTVLAGKAVTFESQPTTESNSYWVSATYIPDFDADEVKGFFSLIEDITERKVAEQMKSEFVSIASHEMRTPLTSIHGVIKLLCAGRLGELTESGQNMAQMALRNSDLLVRLVNDILDLERMESGRDKIAKQTCNSAELIGQALDTLRSMAAQQNLVLKTDAAAVEFLGDRDRLIQTLTNLIGNAIKFSPANSTIWITAREREQKVLFAVKDNGRGIPEDKQESIFERFQQVDASDSRKKGGTGLGLAICRHIVEQHGGKIWVESIFGEGSTFYFSLPIK